MPTLAALQNLWLVCEYRDVKELLGKPWFYNTVTTRMCVKNPDSAEEKRATFIVEVYPTDR